VGPTATRRSGSNQRVEPMTRAGHVHTAYGSHRRAPRHGSPLPFGVTHERINAASEHASGEAQQASYRAGCSPCLFVGALLVLRIFGLLRPFSYPAENDTAVSGRHVMMEGISFLARKPRRGDVVVFKTDALLHCLRKQIFVKRVAGEPGDQLRISDGKLMSTAGAWHSATQLRDSLPAAAAAAGSPPANTDVTVPDGAISCSATTRQTVSTVAFGAAYHTRTLRAACFFVIASNRIGAVR